SSAVLALISFATAALVIPLGMSIESLLMVGMGIQMLPAALALGIYAQYLRQYRKAKGAEAVKKFTEPEGKYAMFNKLGGLTAAKIYLGMIAIALGFNLALGAYPAFAMTPVLVLGAIALTLTIVGFFAKKFWKKSLIGM
ncbi:MAG: hypothetical protein V3S11_00115, partial [Elusimicrobiota bacterium]